MKLYLAGPMRGIPRFNFPAFDIAATILRNEGHDVFNPADRDREVYGNALEENLTGDETKAERLLGWSRREALASDLAWIAYNANGIALLPGWEKSSGAKAELALAEALGLLVRYLPGTVTASVTEILAQFPQRLLSTLTSAERKEYPITTGVLDYFPDAIALVANISYKGNQKHNPGEPLHWARGKSMDHEDCLARHTIERDSIEHAANRAWRALASLQEQAEKLYILDPPRGVTYEQDE